MAGRGEARRGAAGQGSGRGAAWRGGARQGAAWRGAARRGKARDIVLKKNIVKKMNLLSFSVEYQKTAKVLSDSRTGKKSKKIGGRDAS